MPTSLRSLPPPTKKRRKVTTTSIAGQIKSLEDELAEALKTDGSLNKLADLVDFVVDDSSPSAAGASNTAGKALWEPQEVSKGIYALYRTFSLLISAGRLALKADTEAAKAVKSWLWERLQKYTDFLVALLKDQEKVLRLSSLKILFSLQKQLSTAQTAASPSSRPEFHLAHFRKIVSGLLLCPTQSTTSTSPKVGVEDEEETGLIDTDVLDTFYETWFSVYDDIRWFFLRESVNILEKLPANHTSPSKNLLSILERLSTFPTDASELNAWWVTELGAKPPKPKNSKSNDADADADDDDNDKDAEPLQNEEDEDNDDWRKFFDDEPAAPEDATKKKAPPSRLHTMTIHQSVHSLASHKAVFTRCWLTLLPRLSVVNGGGGKGGKGSGADDDEERRKLAVRALNVMHRGVLPHLTRPILVMDWIGGCVDIGGSLGLLALNGLFTLMRDYNLDYPSFYTRLYAFLDRDVLHLRHRARFFRLTELFLGSTHLPATLLASFIKRLARLSLTAPPAAIVMIIPFTYNILKKHPALMVMIHRDGEPGFTDPFLSAEPNPLSTNALDSSLWELYTHRSHYHSTVSTLCKVFSEAFTKPGYAMEDFLDHTYTTLFDTEVDRKIKREPALAMENTDSGKLDLFPTQKPAPTNGDEEEEPTTTTQDIVSELWVF